MDQESKIFTEEMPETEKRSKVAIFVMVLILLAIPVGVYLTLRSNDLRSKANTTNSPSVTAETSLKLKTPQNSPNNQTIFPVDIVVRSDQQPTNLFSTSLNFPVDKLEILAVASSSADLTDTSKQYFAQKWIKSEFNNELGTAKFIAAVPSPGFQSQAGNEADQVLATIYFRSRAPGEAVIAFQNNNLFLKNDNAENALQSNPENLVLQINDSIGDFSEKKYDAIAQTLTSRTSQKAQTLNFVSPGGGEVFSYYKPVTVSWTNQTATKSATPKKTKTPPLELPPAMTVSLFMNDQFLGQLADIPSTDQQYIWYPQKTLPLSYIRPENSFRLELKTSSTVTNQNGEQILTPGPFTLSLQQNPAGRKPNLPELSGDKIDLNSDNQADLKDISYLLSIYLAPITLANQKADLNNDLSINEVDLWYLSNSIPNL